jgi:6,7-dimethyl-8-ribityllumazine synthase
MAGNHRAVDASGGPGSVPDGTGVRVGIAIARFNDLVTAMMLDGVRRALAATGVADADIHEVWVPGAWELPLAAQALAARSDIDTVVAIGCVIRGDTPHFDYVAGGAAEGLLRASLDTTTPVMFGVLTTEDLRQAVLRADPAREDKGGEVGYAAVEMARLLARLADDTPLP